MENGCVVMKILLIGGSGFIGLFAAQQLQQSGHQITIFHRGRTAAPQDTEEIFGDRNFLQDHQPEFRRQKFDVVVDFVLSSGRQAQQLMDTFRGIAGRVVGLSSMDVYRAWGVFYNMEPGGLQELPLTEDSELRTSRNTYPPEVLKRLRPPYILGLTRSMTRYLSSKPSSAIPNCRARFCVCP
jgi:nucleoside-diphosphate-sugar epimerase